LPFKCNLKRYTEAARNGEIKGTLIAKVGLYKL
jgi:hypothetical protein